jgi:hypothetical protein
MPFLFPHFADGGGWSTQVVLVNPTDQPLNGTIEFFSQGTATASGMLVSLTVNGQSGSSFPYAIPARTSRRFETSGSGSSPRVGSVRVTPTTGSRTPAGLLIFSYVNGGITVSEASVPASPMGTAFRMYAKATSVTGGPGSIQTGFAIANPDAAAVTVNFELTTLGGASTGMTSSVTVPANGQIAKFLNEIFPTVGEFEGILRISSTGPIAATGLRGRYNERLDFLITTTAPVSESAPPFSGDLLFPHLADSGGYTTQFILFNVLPGSSTSGVLRILSQSGQSLNLTIR